MAAHNIIIGLLLMVSTTGLEVTSLLDISHCHTDLDKAYGGVRVNCQHQHITSLPLPKQWMSPSITTLLLDYNSITRLSNESFMTLAKHSTLRYLSVSHNRITVIDRFTFSGLVALQKLDLSSNQISLDVSKLNANSFLGLEKLLELNLVDNTNGEHDGQYPDGRFFDLHNLDTLCLETFMGDLNFGGLFRYTKNLSSLTLTGGMKTITNNSFQSLEDIKLKNLHIIDAHYLYITEAGAFASLKYLDGFEFTGSHQNLTITMESLAPFVNRNMSFLLLNGLTRNFRIAEIFRDGTILTRHMARHLSQICVEHFELTGDTIFIIETGALTTPTWRRCLKFLDISNNPLSGEMGELFQFFLLHHLESWKMSGRKYAWVSNGSKYKIWQPPVCMNDIKHFSRHTKPKDANNTTETHMDENHQFWSNNEIPTHRPENSPDPNQVIKTYNIIREELYQFAPGQNFPVIFFPRMLKFFHFQSESYNMMRFNKDWQIQHGQALENVNLADNGISKFTGSIKGLPNLKVVDISMNDGSLFSETFFDSMSSIVQLNMANMNLDTNFMALSSDRLFGVLVNLTTLDLSNNELHFMSTGTFAANEKLSVLGLAGNRFQDLPFDLIHVPNLCSLDLRKNSFRLISEKDMISLENQVQKIESFTLRLDGNEFHCGCNSLRFLAWLQRSRVNFDLNRNYSCTLDSGIRTSTGKMHDLDALWRICHGQKALSLSLILFCLMVLGFVCAIVIPQFKTQLKVFVLKTIWCPLLMKTPDDYPFGVYIGYADQDIKLVCQRLRPYIEKQLHLSTYIRHRDLLPASDVAESMMEAVHSSWRVLLIVSKHFINDPWSFFLLKASTYAVQTDNPGRLVLLLIDDGHQSASMLSRLPNCVAQTVPEESIIMMTSYGNISYEDKQSLRTALIYSGNVS